MKSKKLKARAAGPIPATQKPKTLIAVLSLRDIDGRDVEDGLYVLAPGQYGAGKTRDGVPIGDVTPIGIREAFSLYTSLMSKVRPEVDAAMDADDEFLADVEREFGAAPDMKKALGTAEHLAVQVQALFRVLSNTPETGLEWHHIVSIGEMGSDLMERQWELLRKTEGGAR